MRGEESEAKVRYRKYERRIFKKLEPENKRRCPDCGKLITDYRCKQCWEKLRRRNGIPVDAEGEYDPCMIYL